MNYSIVNTHKADIRQGDTIMRGGSMVTVSARFIKRDPLLGITIYGDSYSLGSRLVEKVIIHRAMP